MNLLASMMFGFNSDSEIQEGGGQGLEAGVYEVVLTQAKVGFGSKKNGLQLGFNIVGDNATKPNIITKAWWFSEKTTNKENAESLYLNPNVVATYYATRVLGMSLEDAKESYNNLATSVEGVNEWWQEQLGTEAFAIVIKKEEEGTDGNTYNKSFIEIGSIAGALNKDEAVCKEAWESLPDYKKNQKLKNATPTVQIAAPQIEDEGDDDII